MILVVCCLRPIHHCPHTLPSTAKNTKEVFELLFTIINPLFYLSSNSLLLLMLLLFLASHVHWVSQRPPGEMVPSQAGTRTSNLAILQVHHWLVVLSHLLLFFLVLCSRNEHISVILCTSLQLSFACHSPPLSFNHHVVSSSQLSSSLLSCCVILLLA